MERRVEPNQRVGNGKKEVREKRGVQADGI